MANVYMRLKKEWNSSWKISPWRATEENAHSVVRIVTGKTMYVCPVLLLFFTLSQWLDLKHPHLHNVFQDPAYYFLSPDRLHCDGSLWKNPVGKIVVLKVKLFYCIDVWLAIHPTLLWKSCFVFLRGSAEWPPVERLPVNEVQTCSHGTHKTIFLSVETSAAIVILLLHGVW